MIPADAPHLLRHPVLAAEAVPDQGGRPPMSHLEALRATALEIIRAGGFPFPCQEGGKRPVTIHGFHDALGSEDRARAVWNGPRAYNAAEATGKPGRFDVLDVDVRPDGTGWEAFRRLKAAGLLAGAQRLVRTPSGGCHLYFAASDQRCGRLPDCHLDFKSRGGYILVPPSQVNGRAYEVLDDRPPTGVVLDWAACVRLLRPPRPVRVWRGPGTGSVSHLPQWLAQQPEGNRNAGLYWAACRAAEAGDEGVLAELITAAVHIGLDEGEARRTVASAARKVNGGR